MTQIVVFLYLNIKCFQLLQKLLLENKKLSFSVFHFDSVPKRPSSWPPSKWRSRNQAGHSCTAGSRRAPKRQCQRGAPGQWLPPADPGWDRQPLEGDPTADRRPARPSRSPERQLLALTPLPSCSPVSQNQP